MEGVPPTTTVSEGHQEDFPMQLNDPCRHQAISHKLNEVHGCSCSIFRRWFPIGVSVSLMQ